MGSYFYFNLGLHFGYTFKFVFVIFGICDLEFGKGNYVFGLDFSLRFGVSIGIDVSIHPHLGLHLDRRLCSRSYSGGHSSNRIFLFYNFYFALYIYYLNLYLCLCFGCAFQLILNKLFYLIGLSFCL